MGLAIFSPPVSGFAFKSYGSSGFEMCHGFRVWPFFVLGFWEFHSKFLCFRVFI